MAWANRNSHAIPIAPLKTRMETSEPRFVRNWLAADLGQTTDYTALIVGETWAATERTLEIGMYEAVERVVHERTLPSYRVVNVHRPRLGTSYPTIALQIAAFLEDMPDADLIVDATGVGRGVVDILRSRGLFPIAISITGGSETNRVSWYDIRVPKVELVSALIAAAQENRLRMSPDLPLRDELVQEIAAFSPRKTATGLLSFEGRDGVHDDLVLALAIGIWHQSQPRPQSARWFHFNLFDRL